MPRAGRLQSDQVDKLIQEIYGTLVEDVSFRGCLQRVGAAFGSHVTAIQSEQFRPRASGLEIIGELEDADFLRLAEEYSGRWSGQNLWIQRGAKRLMEQGFDNGDGLVGDKELLDSEYYRHFLKPVDVRYGMGINLQVAGSSSLAVLSLNRNANAGAFTESDLSVVRALRPHLVNAYAVAQRIARLQDEASSLRASFDRSPLGMLVLDASGRIVDHNEEAARLVASSPRISFTSNGLRLADAAGQAKMRAALHRLTDPRLECFPESILVPGSGENGNAGQVLHLCAFPHSSTGVLATSGRIIAFICDLSLHARNEFSEQVLRMTLNLTAAEASVVMSLRGQHDPLKVAIDMGLAISTVRTHLNHIFRKTGTTRQSELLRVADKLLASAPP